MNGLGDGPGESRWCRSGLSCVGKAVLGHRSAVFEGPQAAGGPVRLILKNERLPVEADERVVADRMWIAAAAMRDVAN